MNVKYKPIETEYEGVLFRSRLEARWAVFFHYFVSARWEYEPEAYALPSGLYLPDFWLPDLDMYAEVKPEWVVDPRHAELAIATGKKVAVLIGPPTDGTENAENQIYFPPEPGDDDVRYDVGYAFCLCHWCLKQGFEFSGEWEWERICRHTEAEIAELVRLYGPLFREEAGSLLPNYAAEARKMRFWNP